MSMHVAVCTTALVPAPTPEAMCFILCVTSEFLQVRYWLPLLRLCAYIMCDFRTCTGSHTCGCVFIFCVISRLLQDWCWHPHLWLCAYILCDFRARTRLLLASIQAPLYVYIQLITGILCLHRPSHLWLCVYILGNFRASTSSYICGCMLIFFGISGL